MRKIKSLLAAAAALLAAPQAAHATARLLDPVPRTLVLTAYAPEWEAMAAVITHGRRVKVNDREIVLGTLAGRPVILMSSGVSMVNAAMNTQLAIDHFRVKRIVFSGVAGGVDPALSIGDVLMSMWGYEQTNVDYYEVTAHHGRTQITLRPIVARREATGGMQGDCTPVPGKFTGEPIRCKVDGSSNTVRLSSFQRASKIEPIATVDGLRVWPVDHWTAYA